MANIISNVLTFAEVIPEPGPEENETFREDAKKRYASGYEVLKAAAEHFKIDQKRLAALVEHWRHINCWHPAIPGFVDAGKPSLASTLQSALQRIDWHSQVTVDFVGGSGGAAWSRSKRTVTVNSEYLERFIAQGVKAEAQVAPRDLDRR